MNGNETALIKVVIKNSRIGNSHNLKSKLKELAGTAQRVVVRLELKNPNDNIEYGNFYRMGNLSGGAEETVTFGIKGKSTLKKGQISFRVIIAEARGLSPYHQDSPLEITIPTDVKLTPKLALVECLYQNKTGKFVQISPVVLSSFEDLGFEDEELFRNESKKEKEERLRKEKEEKIKKEKEEKIREEEERKSLWTPGNFFELKLAIMNSGNQDLQFNKIALVCDSKFVSISELTKTKNIFENYGKKFLGEKNTERLIKKLFWLIRFIFTPIIKEHQL